MEFVKKRNIFSRTVSNSRGKRRSVQTPDRIFDKIRQNSSSNDREKAKLLAKILYNQ